MEGAAGAMVQLLRVLPFVFTVFVARTRKIERRAIARLKDAGANTAERAILLEDAGPISKLVYRRLANVGALVYTGNDRYYLNSQAYNAFRVRRRTRALIVLSLVLGTLAVLYFLGAFS